MPQVLLVTLQHSLVDYLHRLENAVVALFGCKHFQVAFRRNLDVDAHSVGIQTGFGYQLPAGSGYAFQMYVAIEPLRAQIFHNPHKPFHSVISVLHHARTQEQPLDVIAAVELHCYLHHLGGCKCGTADIVATAVDTVGAIEDAVVGQHHFQKRDAASVLGKAVADA